MIYTREGEAVIHERVVDDTHTVTLRAEQIRQERTGVHARLAILMNNVVLSWGSTNIEKDEERVRLSNSAYKHLNGLTHEYPSTYLKHDLDLFCAGLWHETLKNLLPEEMMGAETLTPPTYLLEPYVLDGGGTILFAPPGRGKSFTCLFWAVSIDARVNTSLWRVTQRPVLFINLERSRDSVMNRLGAVNRALGLDATRSLLTLNARGKALVDVFPACRQIVRDRHIGCVFLDSISRAGAGDLTENQPVNRIMDLLNALCPTWVGLAHTPRDDESHLYGGIHFEAGADVVVRLLSEQDEDTGTLGLGYQVTKENDLGRRPMSVIALEFAQAGLRAVRRAGQGEFPNIEAQKRTSLKQEVREYLLNVQGGAASATEIAEAIRRNRQNISEMLAKDPAFVLVRKEGRHVLYGVRAPPGRQN